jgi:hypothetical protein
MNTMNCLKNPLLGVSLALSFVVSGCSSFEPDTEIASLSKAETVSNGFSINGFSINGFSINGFSINGFSINGFSINGFSINGFSINGLSLNGSSFSGVNSAGQNLSGLGFAGAQAQVTVQPSGQAQPTYYTLKFDNVYVDPTHPNSDVYLYDVSYQQSGNTTWKSLCLDSTGNPVPAIPIRNSWNVQTGARIDDANAVTFACVSGALGKCVRLGYRPWAQATRCANSNSCTTVSLADYHQACTRMIRADYCGNSVSYTLNGTLIDVFDDLSPQIQSEAAHWPLEAQWSPQGATCLSDARHQELVNAKRSPSCSPPQQTKLPSCGQSRSLSQALIGTTFNSTN